MTSYENQTVGQIAAEKPATVRVFEKLRIDYCCGGKLPLNQACERAGIPVAEAVSLLNELDARSSGCGARNWKEASASELIAHITGTHHAFVRQEIPRLEALLGKVKTRHGAAHPEVAEIELLFLAAAQELQSHLLREEQVLFPYIEQLERAAQCGAEPPRGCFPSVEFPIARMLADHDDAGELFARMSALSNRYTPPEQSCMSFTALYRGLSDFELDLHEHIHLENNILFPNAIALERELAGVRKAT
ncbi:MAG TPA: iron-sulfur cluster repair di-iron protein [Bryobacteraceae bacterium]|nr:iron-sulfur cluster repair di-iron protein [Bryobacteraceae bacterium]